MKKYLSVFRIRLINSLQYRSAAFGVILSRFLWGLMEVLAFAAIYRGSTGLPMELSQTVSYLWMQQIFITIFSVVFGDGEITASIREGNIAYELVRPMGLYGRWFCQSAATRIAFMVINGLPALILALAMPHPYKMSLPLSAGQFFLFLLSMVLALLVVVSFAMVMFVSLFYTLSHRGMRIIVSAVTTFLSGGIIPLPFFPAPVLAVVKLLPFAAMQNMPLLIYSGNLSGMDAWEGIAFQLVWLAALVFFGYYTMRRALKKVIVQGG